MLRTFAADDKSGFDTVRRMERIVAGRVNAKFYRIELGRGSKKEPFSIHMTALMGKTLAEATVKLLGVSGAPFWCDHIEQVGTTFHGRFCRKQSNNLPPKAADDGTLEPLGVGSIGQTAVWRYDTATSVLGLEDARNGLTVAVFLAYMRVACGIRGYGYLPVVDESSLEQLRQNRVRKLSFQLALPKNLETVTKQQRAMKQAFMALVGAHISSRVSITFEVDRGEKDLATAPTTRLARWLAGESAASRGGISRMRARIIDDEGKPTVIPLLDAVHLMYEEDVELPDDDPEGSYSVRKSFLSRGFAHHQAHLNAQFG